MTSPEKLATPEIISFNNWFVSDAAHAPAQPDEPSDFPARLAQRAWLAAKSAVLATQRQGEGENRKIAQLIIDNDRAGAVKWATGLIGNFDGPSCRIDPDATSQGVAVAQPDAREAALEQAANLVECEYAADATQGRRLAQIAQHIRDLKKRGV